MKRFILALVVGVCAFASGAHADTLENLFGNTLVVTYPSGNQERFYYDADGGFRMQMQAGEIEAHWTRDGESVCIAMEGVPPQCAPMPEGKAAGDAWEQPSPNGGVVRYEILEGR